MPYLTRRHLDSTVAERWMVENKPLTVGRGKDAGAAVADHEMSRQHFVISPKEKGYTIKDLSSRNGTKVNGQPITEGELKFNDQIQAGESTFVFEKDQTLDAGPTITDIHRPKTLRKQ